MKTFSTICLGVTLVTAFDAGSFAEAPKAAAAPAKPVAPLVPPRSIFTMPTNVREGRDPFYPESTHVYDSNVPVSTSALGVTALKVMGYSVVNGHPTVIINNRTFMTGDENDVTSGGGRAHIRCVDIRPGTVTVDVNGIRHEIHF